MENEIGKNLEKPQIFLKSITFNDNTRIDLERNSIIVFTGANNSGKSQTLKDIEIDLSKRINIISGTNGTCKSSILYMVSNAFQEVKTTSVWLKNKNVIKNIKGVNNGINLKIESLTRGDEKYNDPAQGERGSLFICEYEGGIKLEFRRHNTTSVLAR